MQKRIATLEKQLAEWRKDPTADKAFVQARAAELAELQEQADVANRPMPVPPPKDANYFEYELVAMRHTIARDPAIAGELKKLAHDIGQVNLRAAKGTEPPAAEAGAPRYVGVEACGKCHKPAVDFWKTTVHAQAWKTLVDVDKQYNYDCIGCHVTGWQKAGGVNLATVEKKKLVDVQCEVCHGPGSKHVADAGSMSRARWCDGRPIAFAPTPATRASTRTRSRWCRISVTSSARGTAKKRVHNWARG